MAEHMQKIREIIGAPGELPVRMRCEMLAQLDALEADARRWVQVVKLMARCERDGEDLYLVGPSSTASPWWRVELSDIEPTGSTPLAALTSLLDHLEATDG